MVILFLEFTLNVISNVDLPSFIRKKCVFEVRVIDEKWMRSVALNWTKNLRRQHQWVQVMLGPPKFFRGLQGIIP